MSIVIDNISVKKCIICDIVANLEDTHCRNCGDPMFHIISYSIEEIIQAINFNIQHYS